MATRKKTIRKSRQSGVQALLLLVLLVVVVGVLITSRVFVLRDVTVVGNQHYSDNDVRRMAQAPFGKNIFSINMADMDKGFVGNGYVEFVSARRVLPDGIELTVRERAPCAIINYLGVALVVDENGYIMEQSSEVPTYDLPIVTGMQLSTFHVGMTIKSQQLGQIEEMKEVLGAIYRNNAQKDISELNVAVLDNMYLMAKSGMMVMIGDSSMMDEKLTWMRAVLQELIATGTTTGVLDVSSGKSAVYSPT